MLLLISSVGSVHVGFITSNVAVHTPPTSKPTLAVTSNLCDAYVMYISNNYLKVRRSADTAMSMLWSPKENLCD